MQCSALSWRTDTRSSLISAARCGSTTSVFCPCAASLWNCLPPTCPGAASFTATSNRNFEIHSHFENTDRTDCREGQPERQAHLRQVQGDSPASARHGDLLR